MRFKIGDKVKILASATRVGVERSEIDGVGVITSINLYAVTPSNYGIIVRMDEICNKRGCRCTWSVGTDMIKLLPTKGVQLIFNFM